MQRTVIAVLGSQKKTYSKMRTDIKEDGENGKRTWTLTTVVFP
jgi:hypothetical protein